jgi:L-lactate utilization protein LutB
MQTERYTTLRVKKADAERLKIVAALRRESMLETFGRLVQQEYERLQQEGGKLHAADEKDQA